MRRGSSAGSHRRCSGPSPAEWQRCGCARPQPRSPPVHPQPPLASQRCMGAGPCRWASHPLPSEWAPARASAAGSLNHRQQREINSQPGLSCAYFVGFEESGGLATEFLQGPLPEASPTPQEPTQMLSPTSYPTALRFFRTKKELKILKCGSFSRYYYNIYNLSIWQTVPQAAPRCAKCCKKGRRKHSPC